MHIYEQFSLNKLFLFLLHRSRSPGAGEKISYSESCFVTVVVIYLNDLTTSGTRMDSKLRWKHLLHIQTILILQTVIPVLNYKDFPAPFTSTTPSGETFNLYCSYCLYIYIYRFFKELSSPLLTHIL